MSDSTEKEIQKTLEEMRKRMQEAQNVQNKGAYSEYETRASRSKLRLMLATLGVIMAVVASAIFYVKSTGPGKPPPRVKEINYPLPIKK